MDRECFLTSPRQARRRRRFRWLHAALTVTLPALAVAGIIWEMHDSAMQARVFSAMAGRAAWTLADGADAGIWLPRSGPYDIRLGYSRMKDMLPQLVADGYTITEQARQSDGFRELTAHGFYPIYREKSQAGLALFDQRDETLHLRRYPERQYADFDDIPPLLVDALLYVENRGLLDDDAPTRNPAIDWGRLGQAAAGQALRALSADAARAGGSTLATQIEKFRHSPGGRTRDADDKWRQMVSASLRAYQDGEDTLAARRRIVLDFLNSVPLGGMPAYGEVNGLGDGLWAWYGRDFADANRLLKDAAADPERRARAFKEALSLIIAQRRPSDLLGANPARLAALADSHIRLLARDGVIDENLREWALAVQVAPQRRGGDGERIAFAQRKAVNDARVHLGELLGESDLHTLDRLDLDARSTLDGAAQAAVTGYLAQLADPDYLRCAGFLAPRLLARGEPAAVHYSFSLYERAGLGNLLRVQADNLDQPLDINAGTRLDLGSSAKLRTLVSYLAVIADLHRRYAGLGPAALARVRAAPGDRLSRWALDYLANAKERGLTPMLEAALARRYSANPHETFFTGGGAHRFENFKREDDAKNPSVAEALEQSINLSFVRVMRDVVHYHAYEAVDAPARGLRDGDEAARHAFLERFADREGQAYLLRFWHKYRDQAPDERRRLLAESAGDKPSRLAAAYFGSGGAPADFGDFADFVRGRLGPRAGDDAALRRLHGTYAGKSFALADWGYLARLHPLELWLAGHLQRHPEASWDELLAASTGERSAAASWLFKSRYRHAQDLRLAIIVEVAAFERLAAEWRRLGYPFEQLAPSLATAIGSSADRPAALAELAGILLNDGVRRPVVRISELRFAAATPFETRLLLAPADGERVLPAEVAAAARQAMLRVVDNGTARRLRGAYRDVEGTPLAVGGKTGTGDHRYHIVDSSGQSVSSRVMNRAATFAFFLGERFYGVATAYVPGAAAADYEFTSALPVQIVREVEPLLRPLLTGAPAAAPACLQATARAR
ncbi:transglycosylase domain-containing protein [Azospira restricta]|uniref:peptidoglycan glycosyltransferase n=1 Tax=Azospira restricta TaxID=404405 RepID=A0A974PX88_9RHOO|nr:transglycosylase domain-containing protein [Azospira restricta]QRJ62871.1 transglycosylase domain-containing protein [Azospira restricta]